MVLCKNEVHIPLNRAISQWFDTPYVILQAEVGADDYSPKLIKVWVLDKASPGAHSTWPTTANFGSKVSHVVNYSSSEFQLDWPRS